MEVIFSHILNMSMTSSIVILFVMAVRLLLKRAPKIYSYALWSVVLFRLLCPVSLSAPISLLKAAQVPVMPVTEAQSPEQSALTTTVRYVSIGSDQEEWGLSKTVEELEAQQQEPEVKLPLFLAYVWLLGAGTMGLYSALTCLRLRRCLAGAVCYRGNVYFADHIPSAFVLGILFPKIYLPSGTPHRERQYIITHERHHIRRGDHIIKWLAYLALCLHWFNPLAWAAFLLAGKDMEMSCDEAVIKRLGEAVRADYSASLLRLATNRRQIAGTPLSFGEGDTKGRVMNMARWKRPKLWVSIFCMLVCVVILSVCALNPDGKQTENTQRYTTLDNGLSLSLPEDCVWVQNEQNAAFLRDGIVVGGVDAYEKPAFELLLGNRLGEEYQEGNSQQWLEALGLPEANDPDMKGNGMGGSSSYGVYEIEYVSEFPTVGMDMDDYHPDYARKHVFFVGGDKIYDIWLETLLIEPEVQHEILESVVCEAPKRIDPIAYGSIQFTLPEGVAVQEAPDGSLSLIYRTQVVGGIFSKPGKTLADATVPEQWADLEYSGSSSANAGDYLYRIQKDGEAYVFCYVLLCQDQIYYIWHYPTQINISRVEALVDSIRQETVQASAQTSQLQGTEIHTDLELFSHSGSFASKDGTVEYTWNLQDQLVFPEEMATIEVSQRTLSAEEVRKIAETLFEGAVFYQPEDTFEEEYSKAELQKKLELWEHYTDEENLAWLYPDRTQPGDTYIQNEADLVRRFIEDYSARLETAPEEKNDAEYDWVYGNSSYGNGYWTQFEYNGIPYQFHSDGTEISLYIYSGAGPSTIEDDHYEAILTRTDMPTQGQMDAVRAKVEDLIQTIDLGSWQITNCYVEAGAYGEYMTSVAQYKIIVDVQPVFQGTQIMSWGNNGRWIRQGMHLEYAPNGQLMECWLQSFYNLENITQPQPVMDTEDLLQMAEAHLVQNTRSSFGLPEDMLTAMGEEIVCKVTITDMSTGLLLTNHPTSAFRMQYLPGVTFHAGIEYCGVETGKVYLTGEAWTGSALRRILAMDLTNGSIIPYPER